MAPRTAVVCLVGLLAASSATVTVHGLATGGADLAAADVDPIIAAADCDNAVVERRDDGMDWTIDSSATDPNGDNTDNGSSDHPAPQPVVPLKNFYTPPPAPPEPQPTPKPFYTPPPAPAPPTKDYPTPTPKPHVYTTTSHDPHWPYEATTITTTYDSYPTTTTTGPYNKPTPTPGPVPDPECKTGRLLNFYNRGYAQVMRKSMGKFGVGVRAFLRG